MVFGLEATGSMGWFLRLMDELGITCRRLRCRDPTSQWTVGACVNRNRSSSSRPEAATERRLTGASVSAGRANRLAPHTGRYRRTMTRRVGLANKLTPMVVGFQQALKQNKPPNRAVYVWIIKTVCWFTSASGRRLALAAAERSISKKGSKPLQEWINARRQQFHVVGVTWSSV